MFSNPATKIAIGIAALFVFALSGLMVWIYASEAPGGTRSRNFALVDHFGQPVDQTLFDGKPSLVYFGYTHCPVACPTTLFEMSAFLEDLRAEGADLNGYFFTIDPERDDRVVMEQYVGAFSGQITGLTGEVGEMRKVLDRWRVQATKVPNDRGGYSMDHTLSLYLVGSDGRLKGLVPYGMQSEAALDKIRDVLLKQS